MKIIGVREISGVSKETGKHWAGVKLFYTEPMSHGGVGSCCGNAYFGGDSVDVITDVVSDLGGEDYSVLLGADVAISYNRYGRPIGLTVE